MPARRPALQRIEAFGEGGEAVFAAADGARLGGLERLLGWDAAEPALAGELFVVGEIEADEDSHMLAAVFLFRGLAVEFEKDFVAEAEGLLPAFQLVAGLLGGRLVRAEVEDKIGLRHVRKYIGTE